MKEISDYWGGFLAGFTAGEGCFLIAKFNQVNPCANYGCRFKISLRDDDEAILSQIHDTLGIGQIHDKPAYPSDTRNRRPTTVFEVAAINECVELVELFEKYPLRAKKQRDFDIWKLAVAELQKPLNCRDAELLEYYFLKIKEVRKYEEQDELPRPKKIELQLTIEFS